MAIRSPRLKDLRSLRRLNAAARGSSTAAPEPAPNERSIRTPKIPSPDPVPSPILNFTNLKALFSSVTTRKLLKSAAILQMSAFPPMADLGTKVMNSRLMEFPPFRKTVMAVTKHTFYDHFCGGEDLEEAEKTVKELWETGLSAMLDYGLEHAGDNESCDRNLDEFVRTIGWTTQSESETCPVSFVVVKITALCPPKLLKRVSDLLRWEYKDKSLHLPWKTKTFPLFSDSSPLYHTLNRPEPLTPEEERDLGLAYERLMTICKTSFNADVPLLIDAEDSSIQPAIDYFAYSATIDYDNGDDEPLIFNTVQAYLKDAVDRLVLAKKAADDMGVAIGFKLVRGAYMSHESKLAATLGFKSPIHDGIKNTHACYNTCADFMLHEIANGSGAVVFATHNIESGEMACSKAVSLGIERDCPHVHFAQLYGMADALSLALRNAGFRVSKYLPFGPVDQIMPYLLRRAEENKGLLSASSFDRKLMRKELVRRLKSSHVDDKFDSGKVSNLSV